MERSEIEGEVQKKKEKRGKGVGVAAGNKKTEQEEGSLAINDNIRESKHRGDRR